jgi:hypothetical protein
LLLHVEHAVVVRGAALFVLQQQRGNGVKIQAVKKNEEPSLLLSRITYVDTRAYKYCSRTPRYRQKLFTKTPP